MSAVGGMGGMNGMDGVNSMGGMIINDGMNGMGGINRMVAWAACNSCAWKRIRYTYQCFSDLTIFYKIQKVLTYGRRKNWDKPVTIGLSPLLHL
jgi:hypothetical protein